MKKTVFLSIALLIALLYSVNAGAASMPEFTAHSVTLKPGNYDYIEVDMKINGREVANFKAEIYVPDHITISTTSFGVPGDRTQLHDFAFQEAAYDDANGCYRVAFGSITGQNAFGGTDGELFDFRVIADNNFNTSGVVTFTNVYVKFVESDQYVKIDNFTAAINYDSTKEVSENATTFAMGDFMNKGEFSMLSGSTATIPIYMDWNTFDAPHRVGGKFSMPDGLVINSMTQNPDAQPENFNSNNFRCVKTGAGTWQFISVSNQPYYWKTHGTAPCFYLNVTATDDFTGGVITMYDIETRTQKTGDSGSYYCADATCHINVINLSRPVVSVPETELSVTAGTTESITLQADWDSRDRVYSMRVYITTPDGVTPTKATISDRRGIYGHTASITKEGTNSYRIGLSHYDSDEYLSSSYGDLVTVDFAIGSGFNEGYILCDSVTVKTLYYPSGCPVTPFDSIHLLATGSGGNIRGDLNNDGQVNAADVSILYSIILAGEYRAEADVNDDNQVNSADVSALYSIILAGD